MTVRLGFSVAIQVDAEVLLIDEVLAVGDAAFQRKCFDEFERCKAEGRTILFVTHDMAAVERFCDRAMLLEKGRVLGSGDPTSRAQLQRGELRPHVPARGRRRGRAPAPRARSSTPGARTPAASASSRSDAGRALPRVLRGRVRRGGRGPGVRVASATTCATRSSSPPRARTGRTGASSAGERADGRLAFENWLAPSRYTLTPVGRARRPSADALDRRRRTSAR